MEKYKRHFKNGFTLIEILISFGIFAILMGIVLTGFMDTRKLEKLKQSAAELVSTLQKAQNYALTGYVSDGVVPIGGYGVHFDLNPNNTNYFIYADTYSVATPPSCDLTQGNQRYDNVTVSGFESPCLLEKQVGENNFLISGVIIYKIKVNNLPVIPSVIDISFKSPLRMPYVGTSVLASDRNPGDTISQPVEIYLKWNEKNVCRKVSVKGNTGQISEGTAPCPI
jgi:prepilin-type N-terminal cleavage/methylation domain-containing protein